MSRIGGNYKSNRAREQSLGTNKNLNITGNNIGTEERSLPPTTTTTTTTTTTMTTTNRKKQIRNLIQNFVYIFKNIDMLQDFYNNCGDNFKNNLRVYETFLEEEPYKYLKQNMTYNLEKIYWDIKDPITNNQTLSDKQKKNLQLENLIFLPQELITLLLITRMSGHYFENKKKPKIRIDINVDKRWYKFLFDPEWNSETYWKFLMKENRFPELGKAILNLRNIYVSSGETFPVKSSIIEKTVVETKLSKILKDFTIEGYAKNHNLLKNIIKALDPDENIRTYNIENILKSIDNEYPILYREKDTLQRNNKSILLLIFSIITSLFNDITNKIIDYGEIYRIYFRKKVDIFESNNHKDQSNSSKSIGKQNKINLETFKEQLILDIQNFCHPEGIKDDDKNFQPFINYIYPYAQGQKKIDTGANDTFRSARNVFKKNQTPPPTEELPELLRRKYNTTAIKNLKNRKPPKVQPQESKTSESSTSGR